MLIDAVFFIHSYVVEKGKDFFRGSKKIIGKNCNCFDYFSNSRSINFHANILTFPSIR